MLEQLWARCQFLDREAGCRVGTMVGRGRGLGRESHSTETSDFLCLLSKMVTMPDHWQMGGRGRQELQVPRIM